MISYNKNILLLTLCAGFIVSGCTEQKANSAAVSAKVDSAPTQLISNHEQPKQELLQALRFFEDSCGFVDGAKNNGFDASPSEKDFDAFKSSFIGHDSNAAFEDQYYLKSLSSVPKQYRKAIDDIQVEQDEEGSIRYSVYFKNATYRDHDLDKLVIFFKPETDYAYAYDTLYFKNKNFVDLKPSFKQVYVDWLGGYSGAVFNLENNSVTCDYSR
ncbi:hypothetical protein ACT3N8_12525 [Psychrobacter aquimaris]|uniref:hypothetical protein n=1 Tax=Psychrobacter aquimaris TaxID=292733 RepID=UPI003FD42622